MSLLSEEMQSVFTVSVEHTKAANERGLRIGRENFHWKFYLLETKESNSQK